MVKEIDINEISINEIKLRCAVSASVFKDDRDILLLKRSDNLKWGIPGGGIDVGESILECCKREVLEETGFKIEIESISGIYSNSKTIIEYEDGNRYQVLAVNFKCSILGGRKKLNNESVELDFFNKDELRFLDIFEFHKSRIYDSFLVNKTTLD